MAALLKTFKVSIKASEEVSAKDMNEALTLTFRMILSNIGIDMAKVDQSVIDMMEERFTYSVNGKKE